MFGWLVGFLTSSSTTRLYRGRAPRQERLTILRAATHETELGDHDFCLSRSHYTDTDPTCKERAATAGIEPGTSSPGVARSTAELPRPPSYQETSKEIMGHREKKHKEWISQEVWQKIEERRNIKQKLLGIKSERLKEQQKQVYKEADRTVKQLTRRDKRKYHEDMATQAEEAAHKGDQATLYNITKQVCG